ncbi:hypothetical protein HK099_001278, partial [Clydaea vesicula]
SILSSICLSTPLENKFTPAEFEIRKKVYKDYLPNASEADINRLATIENPTSAQIYAVSGVTDKFVTTSNNSRTISASSAVVQNLNQMQLYSGAAYCLFGLNNWSCNTRCTKTPNTIFVEKFDTLKEDTTGFIVYNTALKAIIISFRGTLSIRSAIIDLNLEQVPLESAPASEGVKVHKGFQAGYKVVQNLIRSNVGKLLQSYPDSHIRLTGHSLGGAMATVAALDLATYFPNQASKIQIYTYGQPRVGNPAFSTRVNKLFGDRIFRVTHETDLVTHLPSVNLNGVGAWEHHRREYWIDFNKQTKTCSSTVNEDKSCSAGQRDFADLNTLAKMLSLLTRFQTAGDLIDHLVGYYDVPFGPFC